MKILHVWDQASTASVIAKWQRKIGHQTAVIKNSKHDKLKDTSYYGGFIPKNKYLFVLQAIKMAKKFDIIHLHDAWFMVVPLKILYPKKKIIMHYHGSMVRDELKGKSMRLKWEKLVDSIIVATPDLIELEYSKQPYYIPNPVDTELFCTQNIIANEDYGLILLKKNQSLSRTRQELHKRHPDIDLFTLNEKVEYSEFPNILAHYSYYVDLPIINGKLIHANSVTGLQAMSMGLKVISWDYSITNSLPDYHRPENVVREIDKIYSGRFCRFCRFCRADQQ